jgi:Leucine-rich repeat (LRR) protein
MSDANITKIPTAVTRLEKLTTLAVHRNPITFLSDDDLRNTPLAASLQKLFMSHCQLTSVPDALNLIQQLTTLELSSNHIVKIELNDIRELTRLTNLNLRSNPINYISSHAFDSLGSLSTLNLEDTLLTTIPVAIQPLHQLHYLYLPSTLQCDCADKWLLAWRSIMSIRRGSCANLSSMSVTDYSSQSLPHCH